MSSWASSRGHVCSTHQARSLKQALLTSRTIGARIHDARIAAICLQHGVRELWTADRDFSRFPQLKTFNPLVR
jgi:predicted nucleic acid-binding protein